jgi:LysM repeat protein
MAEQETVEDTGDVVAKSLGVDPKTPVKDVINDQVQFPWLKETQGSYSSEIDFNRSQKLSAGLESLEPSTKVDPLAELESLQPSTNITPEEIPRELEKLNPSEKRTSFATDVMDDDAERTIPQWVNDEMKSFGILSDLVQSPFDEQEETNEYIIKSGDTLSEIAERHDLSTDEILKLNPQVKNAGEIFAGESLKMTGDSPSSPSFLDESLYGGGGDIGEHSFGSIVPSNLNRLWEYISHDKTVRTEKDVKPEEYEVLKELGKKAIQRGQGLAPQILTTRGTGGYKDKPQYIKNKNYIVSYTDYDDKGGSELGYGHETSLEKMSDPAYNMKTSYGVMRLFTDKGKVYLGDEQNFYDPDLGGKGQKPQLRDQPIADRVSHLYDMAISMAKGDEKATPAGLAHKFAEAFGPAMGDGASTRILIGNSSELGLDKKQFKDIPTLKEYEAFMVKTGQLNKKKAK